MTRTTGRRLGFVDAVRALGAVLVLLVLVIGIPFALVVVTPSLIDVGQLQGVLTRPDDGTLFLNVLAAIAWIAWACFAVSVIVEVFAVVRGLPTPRLPMLGLTQRSAAALVGTAAVLLTSNPWTVSLPGVHVAATSSASQVGPAPMRASAAAAGPISANSPKAMTGGVSHAVPADGPSITVRRGDTLWALAERHLGAGSRYREIADLNHGQTQPDGRTLDHAHWIYPGWKLRLPADASNVVLSGSTYTVQPGDTLAHVAAKRLGDADRYPEIADLTRDVKQPNGTHLKDPDKIHPGWTLLLPGDVGDTAVSRQREEKQPTDQNPPAPARPTSVSTPEQSRPSAPVRPTSRPARPKSEAARAASGPINPTSEPVGASESARARSEVARSARIPASPTGSARGQSVAPEGAQNDEVDFPSRLVLGISGLASAGLIGQLTWRRRRQQRHRRPGERIPMPEPAEALVEQTLRAAQEPSTVQDIRRALRVLAQQRYDAGLELPRLLHVRVTPSAVYLDFADDEPDAPLGFEATGARTWRVGEMHRRQNVEALQEEEPDEHAIDPYPVLVTIGVTEDDALLLVNLEAAGSFNIIGDPEATRPVLLALASELTTSLLSQTAAVTLSGSLQGLATVHDRAKVRAADESEMAVLAERRQRDVVQILAAAKVTDIHQARGRRVAEDTWPPDVLISNSEAVSVSPWSGVLAVGTCREPLPGWNLTIDGSGTAILEPGDLRIGPQRLDDDRYAQLLALLATADAEPAGRRDERSDAAPTAILHEPDEPKSAVNAPATEPKPPRVIVLGPVTVEGADDDAIPHRRRRATELVAYLALHPGATMHQIDEAIWPGRRVGKQTRNSFVSRARHWLGHTAAGQPYLPLVADEGHYGLRDDVSCDWHDFVRLVAEAESAVSGGEDHLREALDLVRGRPFLGVDPTTYGWAEADTQDMISAIVDVAHELAQRYTQAGDHQAAQAAAAKGLLAEPYSELIYRDLISVAVARGDRPELERLRRRLRAELERLDPEAELEPETAELIIGGFKE